MKNTFKTIGKVFIALVVGFIITRVTIYAFYNFDGLGRDCFIETSGRCLNFLTILPIPIQGILALVLFILISIGIFKGIKDEL